MKDGILVIQPKKQDAAGAGATTARSTLTVTVPSLRGAELAGSGDITIDRVAGDSFDGAIAGSGNLKVDHIEVGKLKLDNCRVGQCNGRLAAAPDRPNMSIAGSGGIDAKGIAVDTASVSIAGSGNIAAQASNTADRSASWARATSS